jgi:hypothetical protein
MAIAVIGELPGGSAEMDQRMMQEIGVSQNNPPTGGLARLGGPLEGTYQIISVWESEQAWETFKRERMEPALKQMGLSVPEFKVWQLDTFLIPRN